MAKKFRKKQQNVTYKFYTWQNIKQVIKTKNKTVV